MINGVFNYVDLHTDVKRDITGFRSGRKGGLRLERNGNITHAYGVEYPGYFYVFGLAKKVKILATLKRSRGMFK